MIVRPVIGSTTLLTIVISMKRTQLTPLLLSQPPPATQRYLWRHTAISGAVAVDFSKYCGGSSSLFFLL